MYSVSNTFVIIQYYSNIYITEQFTFYNLYINLQLQVSSANTIGSYQNTYPLLYKWLSYNSLNALLSPSYLILLHVALIAKNAIFFTKNFIHRIPLSTMRMLYEMKTNISALFGGIILVTIFYINYSTTMIIDFIFF